MINDFIRYFIYGTYPQHYTVFRVLLLQFFTNYVCMYEATWGVEVEEFV